MELLNFLSRELQIILFSTLPIIELRGAIPYAISKGMHPLHSALLCILGSMAPVPFLLLFLKPFFVRLRSIFIIREFEKWLVKRTERKARKIIKKYSMVGLVLFVSIPLPSTGVWTASIAAALFNLRTRSAFVAILIGNMIAALIVTLLTQLALLY